MLHNFTFQVKLYCFSLQGESTAEEFFFAVCP